MLWLKDLLLTTKRVKRRLFGKSKRRIGRETQTDVFTTEEFCRLNENQSILPCDGRGYFHDGLKEIRDDIDIWDADYKTYWSYPYITWYNR